ncbi:hypothetical protein TNCV_4686031 [Trichonephila clavipes]|nr:hypothetical protein TNCV_4686031 [Trichonephila clavipes]
MEATFFASDDSKIIALRVGEVAGAIGNNYPRALCVDRAGYLRLSGLGAASSAELSSSIAERASSTIAVGGGDVLCCRIAYALPARCFSRRACNRRSHGAFLRTSSRLSKERV